MKSMQYAAFFAATLLVSTSAYAYLDPGTGSILLQGLLAAIAGALVTIRLYWNRIKAFITRKPYVEKSLLEDLENIHEPDKDR